MATIQIFLFLEFPKWPEDFMFKYFHRTPYEHNCLRITNGLSDSTWRNYFFCSSGRKKRINMKWSTFGAQRDMRCININEPLSTQGWKNNYLCLPLDSNYTYANKTQLYLYLFSIAFKLLEIYLNITFNFIDIFGLILDQLTDCLVSNGLPRTVAKDGIIIIFVDRN